MAAQPILNKAKENESGAVFAQTAPDNTSGTFSAQELMGASFDFHKG
jgi:hypothetical protein